MCVSGWQKETWGGVGLPCYKQHQQRLCTHLGLVHKVCFADSEAPLEPPGELQKRHRGLSDREIGGRKASPGGSEVEINPRGSAALTSHFHHTSDVHSLVLECWGEGKHFQARYAIPAEDSKEHKVGETIPTKDGWEPVEFQELQERESGCQLREEAGAVRCRCSPAQWQ